MFYLFCADVIFLRSPGGMLLLRLPLPLPLQILCWIVVLVVVHKIDKSENVAKATRRLASGLCLKTGN